PPSGPSSPPSSAPGSPPSSAPSSKPLAAPSTQPPHPAYVPHGEYVRGTADVGGPTDARAGFSVVGHGAPPPPRERGWGWNDGPPPGSPPPNWEGPPPAGGWGGPPPPGGWNRRWDGPPRDVMVAQADFGPFAYNSYMVIPTFNWMFGGWGYWYFGVWVPLY
ncbi:MAG: MAP_0585 family protein, partial [Mycobacterium sp.]|uniref:MAP_0585 family protein n=1 Tax=Mycobacterium sp. TaxID=1785 RepID=UPI003C5BB287